MKMIKIKYVYSLLLLCFMSPMLLASPEVEIYKSQYPMNHYYAYLFPNKFDSGNNDVSPLLPKDHAHIFSLPFPNSKEVLRVYISPGYGLNLNNQISHAQSSEIDKIYDYLYRRTCDVKTYLFVYNPQKNSSTYLGLINTESGASYGGLYIPYAIRADNKAIILDAWMGDVAAGGSWHDFAYALMPIRTDSKSSVINTYILRGIATRNAVFYDNFSKVIYIDEGSRTAQCIKPGPLNDGVIFYRDLLNPTKKITLADQPDTTYSDISVDEVNKTVSFVATSYLNLPRNTCPKDLLDKTLFKSKSIRHVQKLP